jgi:HemY protein
MCLIMADLERAEHGASGYVAEWLARASRAPHDPAWVADGVVSDHWLPASPVTGRLDAFVWQKPIERLNSGAEADEAVFTPIPTPPPAPLLTNDHTEEDEAPVQADGLDGSDSDRPNEDDDTGSIEFPLPDSASDSDAEESEKPQARLSGPYEASA